jgi:nicotinamide riboside kinase
MAAVCVIEVDMDANQTFPIAGRVRRQIFVNDCIADGRRVLCGSIVEESYVRDSQTRMLFCDTQCLAAHAFSIKKHARNARKKSHEVLKSRLQSQHWPGGSSARLV